MRDIYPDEYWLAKSDRHDCKTKYAISAPHRALCFKVEFYDGLYDVSPCFKPTYHVSISIGVTSHASVTMAGLLDTGAGPSVFNKDFLLRAWKESAESMKVPHLQIASRKVVAIKGIKPLFFALVTYAYAGVLGLSQIHPFRIAQNVIYGPMHSPDIKKRPLGFQAGGSYYDKDVHQFYLRWC